MNAGDTFIPRKPYDHLYMVISDPTVDQDHVVIVNVTTYEPEEEDCCIIEPKEHRFITRRSCVRYKDGRITSVAALNDLLDEGAMTKRDPLSDDLLERVRQGALLSDFLPERCRQILEHQGLV